MVLTALLELRSTPRLGTPIATFTVTLPQHRSRCNNSIERNVPSPVRMGEAKGDSAGTAVVADHVGRSERREGSSFSAVTIQTVLTSYARLQW